MAGVSLAISGIVFSVFFCACYPYAASEAVPALGLPLFLLLRVCIGTPLLFSMTCVSLVRAGSTWRAALRETFFPRALPPIFRHLIVTTLFSVVLNQIFTTTASTRISSTAIACWIQLISVFSTLLETFVLHTCVITPATVLGMVICIGGAILVISPWTIATSADPSAAIVGHLCMLGQTSFYATGVVIQNVLLSPNKDKALRAPTTQTISGTLPESDHPANSPMTGTKPKTAARSETETSATPEMAGSISPLSLEDMSPAPVSPPASDVNSSAESSFHDPCPDCSASEPPASHPAPMAAPMADTTISLPPEHLPLEQIAQSSAAPKQSGVSAPVNFDTSLSATPRSRISPIQVATWQFVIALPVYLVWAAAQLLSDGFSSTDTTRQPFDVKALIGLLWAGALITGLAFKLQMDGMKALSSASHVVLFNALHPPFSAIVGKVLYDRNLSAGQLVGCAFACGGLFVTTLSRKPTEAVAAPAADNAA
jgi:drug/metabolite transporter (DMT)-like permease